MNGGGPIGKSRSTAMVWDSVYFSSPCSPWRRPMPESFHPPMGASTEPHAAAYAAEGILSPYLVQPDAFRLGPLVRAVTERLAERRVDLQLGPVRVVLRGTALLIAGECISLTETEAKLFATLAGKPNVVFAKDYLLRTVWPPTVSDPHTVEVGIARLRKRLGTHGEAIISVRRRGYTLRT